MKEEVFLKLVKQMVKEEAEEHSRKGSDYASEEDCLNNFKVEGKKIWDKMGGKDSPISLRQATYLVWLVYFDKQLEGVTKFCCGKELLSESIENRIKDCRVYLSLLRGLITEEREEKEQNKATPAEDFSEHAVNKLSNHTPLTLNETFEILKLINADGNKLIQIIGGVVKFNPPSTYFVRLKRALITKEI